MILWIHRCLQCGSNFGFYRRRCDGCIQRQVQAVLDKLKKAGFDLTRASEMGKEV